MSNAAHNLADQKASETGGEVVQISIIPQELFVQGQRSIVKVIRSGKSEGLTVAQIAEMTNVTERAVRSHIHSYAIRCDGIRSTMLRSLKDAGVIPLQSSRAFFVPREGVQQLLKIINTSESWAIYYQLWNNSERLAELESKLLAAETGREEALGRITELTAEIALLESETADLNARLAAANFTLMLGGNRRKPRFNAPRYRRERNDIFQQPVYSIEQVKKSVDEMDATERKRFNFQHSSKTAVGISTRLFDAAASSDVTNPTLKILTRILKKVAHAIEKEIMPSEARLLSLDKVGPTPSIIDSFSNGACSDGFA